MGIANKIINETIDGIVEHLENLSEDLRRIQHDPAQANGVDKAIDAVKVYYEEVN